MRDIGRMKRKKLGDVACPIARSLDVIGDWWSLLIIRDAIFGIRRFGEFERSLGLAKNILTTRLKSMVSAGIMKTVPASDGSTYREYVLTEKGEALMPVVLALAQWGGDFLFKAGEVQGTTLDVRDRRPVKRLAVVSQDGRTLGPIDVVAGTVQTAVCKRIS
jgi:DNA-binding HxlR family transcriptional regulator